MIERDRYLGIIGKQTPMLVQIFHKFSDRHNFFLLDQDLRNGNNHTGYISNNDQIIHYM
ncbi:MAG: hypothetical protein F6K24_08460 [Okeania sp. SIO2D1]|uniref:hypothetical protein n=1 Tax=Okeania sp. SIO2C9 TaxID=2607791 RepID=UPI0013BCDFF9|nr:hypothetical protein [Okeania sp. SIO2C9]NEQ76847.1 hypothetical protein [Okeania sp. SIO2C9]NES65281.1 hypothetical protein [Okeania sp. SIO2D1]